MTKVRVCHFEGRIHEGVLVREDETTITIQVPTESNERTWLRSGVRVERLEEK